MGYKQKHKTTNVPSRIPKLCDWVHTQRQQYKLRRLSKERIARLQSIGFAWQSLKRNDDWTVMYNRLVQYQKKYNSFVFNAVAFTKEDSKLRQWACYQRKRYSKGKLSQSRIDH